MKRADRRYRGRKPRGGLTAGQAGIVIITIIVLMMVLTMKVSSHYWGGKSCGEQLYDAIFVAKDWD